MGAEDDAAREEAVVAPLRGEPAGGFVRPHFRADTPDPELQDEGQLDLITGGLRADRDHVVVPIIVAGVSAADLDGQLSAVRLIKTMGLRNALRRRAPPLVAVVGDEALQRLSPSVIGPFLRRPGCVSLACARACPAHRVAEWARCCPMEFVPEGRLHQRLELAFRHGFQPDPAGGALELDGRRKAMGAALIALRGTGDCSVKSWTRALGMTRHALRRLCKSTVGLAPEEIAWACFDGRVRRAVRHGWPPAKIATSVGVANAYVLRRAYARRGLPFPTA